MKPTKKQLSFIETIEDYLKYYYGDDIKFKGNTKKEAQEYISEHIDEFKKVQREVDAITQIEQENFGFLDF